MAIEQRQFLRVNYRQTGAIRDWQMLESVFVHLRQTAQLGSDFAGLATFSMSGYGIPAWAYVCPASHWPTIVHVINVSVDEGGRSDLIYVSIDAESGGTDLSCPASGLTTTASWAFDVYALVASR